MSMARSPAVPVMRGRTAFFPSQLSSACSIIVFLGVYCSLSLPSDRTSQSGLRSELISSVYPKVVPVKVDHFSETLLSKSITEGEERQNREKPVVQKTWKKMKE